MTSTQTTQTAQTIKITKAYFDYPTGDSEAPDRERIEGTYNVLVDGVDVGQVARDEWVTAGYWGAWKAGRDGFEKRGQAVAYLVKRYNDRLAAEAAEKANEATIPDLGMFTDEGNLMVENAAVLLANRYVQEGRTEMPPIFDFADDLAATLMLTWGRVEEASDTVVRESAYDRVVALATA